MHQTHEKPMPDVQVKAIEVAGKAIAMAVAVKAPLRSIAEQAIRAAASVPANIAEGAGRSGRDRYHHWRIAYGSANELEVHLQLLASAGAVNQQQADLVLHLLDDVRAMLWRMTHPR